MTALTDNLEAKRQDGELIATLVKSSTTIYKGALVVDLATGYASPGDDGSGYIFLGVAMEKADNSSGADGATKVRLYKTGVFEFTKATAVQTDLGVPMYIHDDQTVGTSSTNSILAGYCVDIVDSSTIKLRIDVAVR